MKNQITAPIVADVLHHRELLDAWCEGHMWGVLYRAAMWPGDGTQPPKLDELRACGDQRYEDVLRTIARWRSGGVWALVLWEQDQALGGGVFFSVEEYRC